MPAVRDHVAELDHSMPAAAKAQLGQTLRDLLAAVAELQTLQIGVTQPVVTALGTRKPVK